MPHPATNSSRPAIFIPTLPQNRAEISQDQSRGRMEAKVRPLILGANDTDTKATNPATARQIDFSDLV